MKNKFKLLVVIFHIAYSILANYMYINGDMSDGALPLVVMINLITLIWILAFKTLK